MIYQRLPELHVITAAGGVVWRQSAEGFEVAVVHRPRYDDWSLPRGHPAAGEHHVLGAAHDVREETGVRAILGWRLPDQRYENRHGPERVEYWAMRAAGGRLVPGGEVDRLAWLAPLDARDRLTRPGDRGVVEALGDPREVSVLALVRHASAGDPEQWAGDDRLRPLDAKGESQAAALGRVLPLFGVSRMGSVPNTRCLATLAGLASHLGEPIVPEPSVEESAYRDDPSAAVGLVRRLAAGRNSWAVCSQADVIPDLGARLAAADGLAVGGVRAKKGSVCMLFFRHGRLFAADHYPSLR